jgi:hypothetical protein
MLVGEHVQVVVEIIPYLGLLCNLPIPLLSVLFLHEAGYNQDHSDDDVFRVHVCNFIWLFLHHRHDWILIMSLLRTNHLCSCED